MGCKARIVEFVCAVFLLVACSAPGAVASGNLLRNGDFESGFDRNGIADGWLDDSAWSMPVVTYSPDSSVARTGNNSQRIEMKSGVIQFVQSVSLKKNVHYRVRVSLKGDVGSVQIRLRQAPSPWHVYAERVVDATAEWTDVDFVWTCNVDDPRAWFMIRFTRPGTLWVDDAAFEEISQDEVHRFAVPPQKGNLIRNGSFHLGLANWMVNHLADDVYDNRISVVRVDGVPTLRFQARSGSHVAYVSSESFRVYPGNPIKISFRIRADREVPVHLIMNDVKAVVTAGPQWQDFETEGFVGFLAEEVPQAFLQLLVYYARATVWIQDVQVRQDSESPGPARQEAALIADRHPFSYYGPDDLPRLFLMSYTPAGASPSKVNWQVRDYWGRTVLEGDWLPGGGAKQQLIDVSRLAPGWYHASVIWGQREEQQRFESTFSILPPPDRPTTPAESFFGAHFALNETGIALGKAVGARSSRLHFATHTKWYRVEPEPGKWVWNDTGIWRAFREGVEVFGSLSMCPVWASSAPEGTPDDFWFGAPAWVPRDWSEWEKYVSQVVGRYRNEIQVWEIGNEVDQREWLNHDGSRSQADVYLDMLKHSYPIIKRVNPDATAVGFAVTHLGKQTFALIEEVTRKGGLDYMDVLSFHCYQTRSWDEVDDSDATTPERNVFDWLDRLRRLMRDVGREIPIIHTEGGFPEPGTSISYRPFSSATTCPKEMARVTVRNTVSYLAHGVRRVQYYNFAITGLPIERSWDSFVEGDGQPRPVVSAYAVMTWLLDGAEFDRTERPDDDTWLHYFATPRGTLIVAWTRSGTSKDLVIPGIQSGWDIMGAPVSVNPKRAIRITDTPVYLLRR